MKYRVMIVDDQYIPRQMFKMYIESSENYELAYSISSAMFADIYVLTDKVDLVLMDILMKDESNGLEAAAKIKKTKPDIKIIAVTSMPEVSWLEKAREIGIDSFWYKEAPRETILSVMDRTMKGESVYPDKTPTIMIGEASSENFTEREIHVLRLLTTGATNGEIAQILEVSENTIKTHVRNLISKTGCKTRTNLAIQARVSGFVISDI